MPAERARAIIEMSVSGQSNVDRAMEKASNRTNQLERSNEKLSKTIDRHSGVQRKLRTNYAGVTAAAQQRVAILNKERNALRSQAQAARRSGEKKRLDAVNVALEENATVARRVAEEKQRDQAKINRLVVAERRSIDEATAAKRRNSRAVRSIEAERRRSTGRGGGPPVGAAGGVSTAQLALLSGNALIGAGAAATGVLYVATRAILEYNTVLNELKAISGASAEETKKLAEQSRHLGVTTEKSASDAASGQRELARAGFTVNQIYDATPGVLALSTIGNIEMGSSAEYLAGTLKQFSLDASESNRVVDVLAQAVSSSLFDIEGLGTALGTAGTLASQFNISLERTVAVLSTIRSAGVQASKAGTGLRSFFAAVANMSSGDAQALRAVGVEVEALAKRLAQGDIVGIGQLLEGVNAGVLTKVFGTEAASVASIVSNTHEEIAMMERRLLGADGAAQEMRDTMNEGIVGAFREVKSAVEGALLSLGDSGLTSGLTGAAKAAKSGLTFFDALPGPLKSMTTYLVLAGPLFIGAGIGLRLFSQATQHATLAQIKLNLANIATNLGLVTMKQRAAGAAASLGALRLGAIGAGVLALGVGLGLLTWHLNNVRESAAGAFDSALVATHRNIEALSQIAKDTGRVDAGITKMIDDLSRRVEAIEKDSAARADERKEERFGVVQAVQNIPAVGVNMIGQIWSGVGEWVKRDVATGEERMKRIGATVVPVPAKGSTAVVDLEGHAQNQTGGVFGPSTRITPVESFAAWLGITDNPEDLRRDLLIDQRQLADVSSTAQAALARERGIAQRNFLDNDNEEGVDAAQSGGTILSQSPFQDNFYGFGEVSDGGVISMTINIFPGDPGYESTLKLTDVMTGGLGE